MTSPIDINVPTRSALVLETNGGSKIQLTFPQVNQSTGHHDTDKWIALKVSPSPDPLTKCSNRSRESSRSDNLSMEQWSVLNLWNVTWTLDPTSIECIRVKRFFYSSTYTVVSNVSFYQLYFILCGTGYSRLNYLRRLDWIFFRGIPPKFEH